MAMDRRQLRAERLMVRASESNYMRRLLQVSRQVDSLVRGMMGQDPKALQRLEEVLRGYADLLLPWAETVAKAMVLDVAHRNLRAWKQNSEDISKALRVEIENAPTGHLYSQLMQEQVQLIRSLPLDAAERVHERVLRATYTGERAATLEADILKTGHVTASRARLIARTEVSRSASALTQARAQYVGSEGYIWRTSRDAAVRDTHRKQEGKFIHWNKPPKTDKGLAPYHAGCGPNCRCFPEPVLPDY